MTASVPVSDLFAAAANPASPGRARRFFARAVGKLVAARTRQVLGGFSDPYLASIGVARNDIHAIAQRNDEDAYRWLSGAR